MLKRILILGLSLVSLGFITSCSNNLPYNAIMYGKIYTNRTYLEDDFYEANLTFGSWSSELEGYLDDETYPPMRTIIITNSNQYREIFNNFPEDINFENTMIIMHCFTTSSGSSYEITSIDLEGELLSISYKTTVLKRHKVDNASVPLTKWIIVTMDKLEIKTVEFIYGTK